ncbi:MAG: hypothetical protein LQ340_002433 [Diploschistes diacapsis]|nr:MAG: hypothetical protein LQ340_002433 [Diploschistes diacapsis]
MNKFTKAITIESIGSSSSRLTGSFSAVRARSTTNKDPATRVRTVEASEWKAAAACLADAFAVDDVATYFLDCPDTASWSKERKWALHVKILQVMTFAHIKCGLVQAIGDPTNGGTFDAVALWMPPDTKMDGWLTIVRMGLWRQRIRLEWLLSKEGRARFFKEFMPLLHTTKAEADVESRACYLESSNVVNVAIYRKFGFEPTKQIHLRRAKKYVSLDIMVREPVTEKLVPSTPPPRESAISHSVEACA